MTLAFHTIEARWFARGPLPDAVRAWFDALGPAAEPASRTDRYLAPTSDALGVKLREGNVEAKRRAGAAGRLDVGRAAADVEAWVKWSFARAGDERPEAGWLAVEKTRWQRRAEPAGGTCTLELAEVVLGGERWWSVCLEASGSSPAVRRAALDAGARRWLSRDDAPALPDEAACGYPAWLRARG